MIRICRVVGYAWLAIALLMMLAGFVLVWRDDGFRAAQDVILPRGPVNVTIALVLIGPGVALLLIADALKRRARRRQETSGRAD